MRNLLTILSMALLAGAAHAGTTSASSNFSCNFSYETPVVGVGVFVELESEPGSVPVTAVRKFEGFYMEATVSDGKVVSVAITDENSGISSKSVTGNVTLTVPSRQTAASLSCGIALDPTLPPSLPPASP